MTIVPRPRVTACVARAARYRIALVIAAPGSGKSVALREYLAGLDEPVALIDAAVGIRALTAWLHERAHFAGVAAIDGLEDATSSPECAALLRETVEATRGRVRWVFASRGSAGIPLGSWLAYGDAGPVVRDEALRFTAEEVHGMARAYGVCAAHADDVVAFTHGWAIAAAFALRALAAGGDVVSARAQTADAVQEFLRERVCPALSPEALELLDFAALLPSLDPEWLERVGCGQAYPALETLQRETSLVRAAAPGRFVCEPLVAEFFRRRVELLEPDLRKEIFARAGAALEAGARIAEALDAYVNAGARAAVERLLVRHGLELVDRACVTPVARALETLAESTRREHPAILAVRGAVHAASGRPQRAEALLRRSLFRAGGDADATAVTQLRLALLLANRGDDVAALLEPIAFGEEHSPSRRAEALSLIAAHGALAGRIEQARSIVAQAESLLPQIELDDSRARILQRIGVTALNVGDVERAKSALHEAADLAMELQLYSLASRSYANLCNLTLYEYDEAEDHLRYAKAGAEAAALAGNAFDLETALLQLLRAEVQNGDEAASTVTEAKLAALPRVDPSRKHLSAAFRGLRLAWNGQFAEAHRLLAPCCERFHYEFDRLVSASQCALFEAIEERVDASHATAVRVARDAARSRPPGLFARRRVAIAQMNCAIAQALNGYSAKAERVIGQIQLANDGDPLIESAIAISRRLASAVRHGEVAGAEETQKLLRPLNHYGHADAARLLAAAWKRAGSRRTPAAALSPAEVSVLHMLNEGLSPKEIALRSGRSVFTIRAHIANAIGKLNCRGRNEAVAAARRLGLLPSQF